jgi:glycerol-3-phosphate dehydrogenase subunit C
MDKSDLDQCIKCSICTAFCPVLKATGLFPGPKLAGPDAERFRQKDIAALASWIEFCDYCKICERVCPYNVPIPWLHLRSRLAAHKQKNPSFRDWLLGHAYYLAKLGKWGAPFSNWIYGWSFWRWLLERGLGIAPGIKLPFSRGQTFAAWFKTHQPAPGNPLAYFYGCHTNYVDPQVGRDVVFVLEKNGFAVFLPEQECCALPLISNGFADLAANLAQKNLTSFKKVVAEGVEIVFSSPSCGMTIKEEYEQILHISGAKEVGENFVEISQFLWHLYEQGKLRRGFKEIRETFYYHAPCHLRALKIGLPALDLLSLIPGLQVVEIPEGCCGLAGTYGLKKEKYKIANEIGEEIFRFVRRGRPKGVISDCEACRLQIERHTGIKTYHPIQILRQAYEV